MHSGCLLDYPGIQWLNYLHVLFWTILLCYSGIFFYDSSCTQVNMYVVWAFRVIKYDLYLLYTVWIPPYANNQGDLSDASPILRYPCVGLHVIHHA